MDILVMYFQSVSLGGSKYFYYDRKLHVDISLSLSFFFPPLSDISVCICFRVLVFISTCKKNQGIYSAMRLDKVFNISSYLNTTVVSNLYVLCCSYYYDRMLSYNSWKQLK